MFVLIDNYIGVAVSRNSNGVGMQRVYLTLGLFVLVRGHVREVSFNRVYVLCQVFF